MLGNAKKEGGAAKVVDLASNALGVVVNEGKEGVGENRLLTACDDEMVLDVGGGLLEVEGVKVVADGDALAEGLKGSEAQLVGPVGLAEENKGEQGGRIHVVVEQKAELVEDVVREKVCFVNDEENGTALACQAGDVDQATGADLRAARSMRQSALAPPATSPDVFREVSRQLPQTPVQEFTSTYSQRKRVRRLV